MTGEPFSPPMDETMMMAPSPRASICGAANWISQWLETMLLSKILRNWSSVMPACGPK